MQDWTTCDPIDPSLGSIVTFSPWVPVSLTGFCCVLCSLSCKIRCSQRPLNTRLWMPKFMQESMWRSFLDHSHHCLLSPCFENLPNAQHCSHGWWQRQRRSPGFSPCSQEFNTPLRNKNLGHKKRPWTKPDLHTSACKSAKLQITIQTVRTVGFQKRRE